MLRMKVEAFEKALLAAAIIFIIWLSAVEGPLGAAQHSASHLIADLRELPIHIYLAGWAILIWLAWRKLRRVSGRGPSRRR